jgi:peroxiredoxin
VTRPRLNHRPWIIVVAAGALGLLGGAALDYWQRERATRALVETSSAEIERPDVIGTRRPDVRGRGLDGDERTLAAYDGRVILLNFWATWCPPCVEEIPALMAVQDRLGPEGLQVVGLALDEFEATREFAAELGIDYPVLVGGETAFSVAERFGNLPATLPYTAVIDRDGVIRAVHRGALTREEAAGLVEPLL